MKKYNVIITENPAMSNINITIVPTVPAHLRELATNLRPEDYSEIIALGSPERTLWKSYKGSILRKTALIDGKVAACWGVGGAILGSVGQPWLLTSPEVKKVSPLKFVRIYQIEVLDMLRVFPKLANYCASEYTSAIRLLDIVGFKLGEPEMIQGTLMRKFEKER